MELSLEERLEATLNAVSSCNADKVFIDTCAFSLDSWNADTFSPYFSWTKHGYPEQRPSTSNAAYDQHRVIRAGHTLLDETGGEVTQRIHDEFAYYTMKIVDAYRTFRDTSNRLPEDILYREGVVLDQLGLQKEVSSSLTGVSPSILDVEDVNRRLTPEEKYSHEADIDLVASAYLAGRDEKVALVTRDYDIPYLSIHAEKNSRLHSDVDVVFVGDSFVAAGPVDAITSVNRIDSRIRRKFEENPVHYSGY